MENKQQQAEQFMHDVLTRSATDWDFRQQLLEDPTAAIAEFTGREPSESVNIVFVENKVDATFVLPDPVYAESELSEEELEAVAGGDAIAVAASVAGIVASLLCVYDAWFD